MRSLSVLIILATSLAVFGCGRAVPKKPDFVAYEADGSLKMRGVYQTDADGRVVKYTLSDGAGKTLYIQTPYYAPNGAIVRADQTDAAGNLQKVVVYLEDKALVFDAEGKLLDTQAFSQSEFMSLNAR